MKSKRASQAKKPYRPPRLTVYGDLRRLTLGGGGTKREGGPGGPKTKAGSG